MSNEQKVRSNEQKVTATRNEEKVQPLDFYTTEFCHSLFLLEFGKT